jgi:hypothetical protein
MKFFIMIVLVLIFIVGAVYAEQRYNANEGRWETIPDGSNWTPRYNPQEGEWSYQPQNARTQYNAMEGTWDWDSGHNPGSDD